jgi:hypothetical protein
VEDVNNWPMLRFVAYVVFIVLAMLVLCTRFGVFDTSVGGGHPESPLLSRDGSSCCSRWDQSTSRP